MILLTLGGESSGEKRFSSPAFVKSWLCKHGVPSLSTGIGGSHPADLLVIITDVQPGQLRGFLDRFQNKGVYQGPFHADDLEKLGIKATTYRARSISMECAGSPAGSARGPWDGSELFGYTKERYKYPDKAEGAVPCEQAGVPDAVTFQSLEAPQGWREAAWVTAFESDGGEVRKNTRLPIAITLGGLLLLGAPLIDLACHKHFVFASKHCLGFPERLTMSWRNEKWLVSQMERVALAGGFPFLRILPWPQGKRSAFTIRHDYDRPVSPESLEELLAFYAEHGFKASFGFKPGLLDEKAIAMVLDAGHEVALHTESSPCSGGLAREVEALQAVPGVRLSGVTAHGGAEAVGFVGSDQVAAAEEENLLYFETSCRDTFLPHQILLHRNGACECRAVLAPGMHFSLDTGTRPETHRADELLAQIPSALMEGGHVTLMNHPDINRKAFLGLFEHLPLAAAWFATHKEALERFRSIMYAHALENDHGLQLVFSAPRDQAAVVRLKVPGKVEKELIVPAGETPYTVHLADYIAQGASSSQGRRSSETLGVFALNAQTARHLAQDTQVIRKGSGNANIRMFSESMLESVLPTPGNDCSSLYYVEEQRQFDAIVNGLPLFKGAWGTSYAAWLTRLLKPGGSIFFRFNQDDERRGFLSRETIQDLYGQQGKDIGEGGLTEFQLVSPVQAGPSVLDWFMRNKHKAVLDDLRFKYAGIQDPRLFDPLYAEFLEEQQQFDFFLKECGAPRAYLGLGDAGPIADVDKELGDILRTYSYYVGGIRYKGAVVAQIIKDLLGDRRQLTALDIGGGMGLLSAEMLLDESLDVSRAVVRDLNYLAYIQAGNLYSFYREQLKGRFSFSFGAGETYACDHANDVVTLLGALLYADKDAQPIILQKAWDSLTPGGLLIIHENMKSPTYLRDYKYMFTPDKLDSMLKKFGRVQYYLPNALLPATALEAKKITVFRVIQKEQGIPLKSKRG